MDLHVSPLWTLVMEAFGSSLEMGLGYSRSFAYFYRTALQLYAITVAPPGDDTAPRRFGDDDGRQKEFERLITRTQRRSFWLLWKWWEACQEECDATRDEDEKGQENQPLPNGNDATDPEAQYYPNTREVHDTQHTVAGIQYRFRFQSLYNKFMENLFNMEFDNYVQPISPDRLIEMRVDCARESACLHIALECHYSGEVDDEQGGGPVLRALDYVENYAAHFLLQDFRSVNQGERRILLQDDLPGLDPLCTTGSSIESCPWLEDISGLPFYLWDRVRRETVEVHTLTSTPSYTAISHTWGRWQKNTAPVEVPGVHGWLVPENSLFDVKELPSILAGVPTHTRFVWFDLVCIPQDRSPRAIDEISRQAAIFKGARHAVAWWNRTGPWKGMRAAIRWMSQLYLDWAFSNDQPVFEIDYQDVRSLATGMFDEYSYSGEIQTQNMTPLSWLSSLWTLQEVCLRPDIWLCNKEWELFTVGRNTPVALNTIVALTQRAKDIVDSDYGDRSVPAEKQFSTLIRSGLYQRGFLELVELFRRTGMDGLHSIQREHVLLLATSRYCKRSRAEAIMSVLGMKEWIKSAGQVGEDQQLVLGQFPLAFVREVRAKLQSNFFTSILTDPPVSHPEHPRGTMLPFRANIEEQKTVHLTSMEFTDHPSVSTWEIQSDGTANLREAEILFSSSSDAKNFLEMRCIFNLAQSIPPGLVERDKLQAHMDSFVGDLRFWVKEQLPRIFGPGRYFAVKLRSRRGQCDGLLLKEAKEIEGRPSTLFKIGNFHMLTLHPSGEYIPLSSPQMVNWLIL